MNDVSREFLPRIPYPSVFRIATVCSVALFFCSGVFLNAENSEPELTLRRVLIRAIDENGEPVEGVTIHRSVWTEEEFKANADYTTNSEGEVGFEVPKQVSIIRLWARKKGMVPMFANFDANVIGGDPVPEEFVFWMRTASRIGGRVVDEEGNPIAGARVEVSIDSEESMGDGTLVVGRWLATGEDSVWTDDKGNWILDNVPPGDGHRIGLRLFHPDFVDAVAHLWRGLGQGKSLDFQELRNATHRSVMEEGTSIRGWITGPDGKGVAKAMVVWGEGPYHNGSEQEAFTLVDGSYELPPISSGLNFITVVAEGYSPQFHRVSLSPGKKEMDFALKAGSRLQVTFRDRQGEPIPGVRVNILSWRGKDTLFNWRHSNVPYSQIPDRADQSGVYLWDWAPSDPVTYYFSKKGYRDVRDKPFRPGEYDFVLDREPEN